MTRSFKLFACLLIGSSLLPGCFFKPSRSYDNTYSNVDILQADSHNIDQIKPIKLRVSSQKAWQNSGVFVQRGDTVTIKSYGKWSPWAAVGAWTGPEGNSIFATEVSGIPGSALMARLGHKGRPFLVGLNRNFIANDYGMLYMAMNDSFNHLFDNEGDVGVEVYLDSAAEGSATQAANRRSYDVSAYSYDDNTGKGYISVVTKGQDFAARQWVLNKIGEIASTKNVAIDASRNRSQGGSYRVTDEKSAQGVLSVQFETIW